MHLKLREQQLKTILYMCIYIYIYIHTYTIYIYICIRLLYQNLMVTANQKSTIDTQKRKKERKHKAKDSHQITREENKRGWEENRPE